MLLKLERTGLGARKYGRGGGVGSNRSLVLYGSACFVRVQGKPSPYLVDAICCQSRPSVVSIIEDKSVGWTVIAMSLILKVLM